jgi:hypothetical protein
MHKSGAAFRTFLNTFYTRLKKLEGRNNFYIFNKPSLIKILVNLFRNSTDIINVLP